MFSCGTAARPELCTVLSIFSVSTCCLGQASHAQVLRHEEARFLTKALTWPHGHEEVCFLTKALTWPHVLAILLAMALRSLKEHAQAPHLIAHDSLASLKHVVLILRGQGSEGREGVGRGEERGQRREGEGSQG